MKLWHDDVRPAPEGWALARNNQEAIEILETGKVTEISLDHDLGATPGDGIYAKGASQNGSGYDLVVWMIANRIVPDVVTIHSWNPVGAQNMARALRQMGYRVIVEPYRVTK